MYTICARLCTRRILGELLFDNQNSRQLLAFSRQLDGEAIAVTASVTVRAIAARRQAHLAVYPNRYRCAKPTPENFAHLVTA